VVEEHTLAEGVHILVVVADSLAERAHTLVVAMELEYRVVDVGNLFIGDAIGVGVSREDEGGGAAMGCSGGGNNRSMGWGAS